MRRNTAMDLTALIELTRGGMLECLHLGAVAVLSTRGQVVAQAGHLVQPRQAGEFTPADQQK